MGDDVLVVLGAAVWPGGVASPTLARRTEWACTLFEGGGYDAIVLSGGVGRYPPAEADVMSAIAQARGIPQRCIILDRAARRTIDTAEFAAAMPHAATRHFTAVTDFYHAPRTRLAFRTFGLAVTVRSPPIRRHARPTRLLGSLLREVPAVMLYATYFLRRRLRGRR